MQGGSSATGTITPSGLYTAPSSFDSGKSVTITATSQSNSSVSGSATAVVVDNASSEAAPVKLGTTGGNATDFVKTPSSITCCSGTLGSLIQSGGNFFILSNNHVLDKSDTGTTGQNISQPGLIDNNCNPGTTVANLTQAAALKPTTIITTGACATEPAPCGPAPSNVDAAIAQIVAGEVDTTGSILDLGPVNGTSITAMPPSSTLANPATVLASNEGVAKSGRSSGLTCSTLQSVSTTISVQYNSSCGGSVAFTSIFANQVVVNGGSFSAAGDSGSLIVTSDTARPVALLYGGNRNGTSGNPIQDVLNRPEFNKGSQPVIVGTATDHAVSCSAVSGAAVPAAAVSSVTLTPQEHQRVTAVQRKRAPALMADPAIAAVDVGASEDSPGEGALAIQVSGPTRAPVPAVIDGVRTKVVAAGQVGPAQMPVLKAQDMDQAAAVKENHADALMSQPGVQGVGVGRSNDNTAETAIVIYVVSGMEHGAIPATLDGVRTKIVEGDRFRAFGWGKEREPVTKCVKR